MLVSEFVAGGLQMKRNRVMDPAFDLLAQQRRPDSVAPVAADDEQVVARLDSLGLREKSHAVVRQSFTIKSGKSPALRVPILEALELGTQHRCLKSIEPRVVSVRAVSVVRQPAVIAQ